MKKTTVILTMVVATALGVVVPAQGANWYWFGDDTTEGGDGPWNFTDVAWRTHPTVGIFTNWVAGNAPVFRTNPGTVTLETNILVSQSMNVTANMTFDGPFTLQLSGGTHVTSASVTATVNCAVQLLYNAGIRYNYLINGSISDDGANRSITHYFETLTLNGSNSFGGGVALNSGTLVIGDDHALGTGDLTLGYDGAVLKAGGGVPSVANLIKGNWNWRLNFEGANDLTCTATQGLYGTAAPWPRFNVVETNATLTYGGLKRNPIYDTMMIKEGPGTFVIEGAYDASYGTVVTGGVLVLNGTTTAVKNNYGYTVHSGAALGGTGTINLAAAGSTCLVERAGALAPGASAGPSVGTLTINGPVALEENAIYRWNYQDGVGDLVDVNGTLVLPSVATVMVSQISGDLPAMPTLFTFDAHAGATTLAGWVTDAGYTVDFSGNSVVLVSRRPSGTLFTLR